MLKERTTRWNSNLKVIRSLIADSILRFKGRAFLVTVAGFLGVAFQVQAIALAFYYAKAIDKGHIISHFGYSIDPRTSVWFLILVGVGVLLSLLLSAGLVYFSRIDSLKLMRRYEEFCAVRTFSLFGSNIGALSAGENIKHNDVSILKLASSDSRFCGRALLMLLKSIVPVITFMIAAISLAYINALLTLSVFVIIALSARFQYHVNVRGARSTRLMEKYAKGFSGEYRNIIRRQMGTAVPLSAEGPFFQKLFRSGEVKRYLDAFNERYMAMDNSRFVSDVLLAVTIFAIILIFGTSIIMKGQGWGGLIIYLIALRYMLVNLKQSVSRVTAINRYFLPLKRYFQFIESFERPSDGGEPLPGSYIITVGPGGMRSEKGQWELKKGGRIGMMTPVELNRYTVTSLAEALLGSTGRLSHKALTSLWFVKPSNAVLPLSLRDMFGLPSGYTWEKLGNDTAGSGLWDRLQGQLPHTLGKTVSTESWTKVDQDIRFALNMLSAFHSESQWIMIEEKGLRLLSDDACKFFMGRLSDRIVVIVYNRDLAAAGRYDEEIFALVDNGKTIGLGSAEWVRANESFITGLVSKGTESGVPGGQRDDLDDDQDDDDM